MFTIKYIMTDGSEMIDGPFEGVSAVRVDRADQPVASPYDFGALCVTARRADCGTTTYGPIFRDDTRPEPIAFVYVMNANGATVAKYEL